MQTPRSTSPRAHSQLAVAISSAVALLAAGCGASSGSSPDAGCSQTGCPSTDAQQPVTDSAPGTPDAMPGMADAMPDTPDAMPSPTDAMPLPPCDGPVFDGDAYIYSLTSLPSSELQAARCISGNLEINWTGSPVDIEQVALENLVRIDGNLTIRNSELVAISLTGLERIGGTLDLHGNSQQLSADLSALQQVDGSLLFSDNQFPITIDLSALDRVAGNLLIKRASADANATVDLTLTPALRLLGGDLAVQDADYQPFVAVRFPALEQLGGTLQVSGNVGLAVVDLPQLRQITGSMELSAGPSLAELSLGSLQRLTGAVVLDQLQSLEQLQLPSLTELGAGIIVDGCPRLHRLEMPQLTQLTELKAYGSKLTQLNLRALQQIDELRISVECEPTCAPPTFDYDLSALQRVTDTLDLSFNTLDELAIELPALVEVSEFHVYGLDGLSLAAPQLRAANQVVLYGRIATTTMSLPALQSVTSSLEVTNTRGHGDAWELPSLRTVGGALTVEGNDQETALGPVRLDALESVGGALSLRYFGDVALPALANVGDITLADSTQMQLLELPAMASAGEILLVRNSELASLRLPELTTAKGLSVGNNPQLAEIQLSKLSAITGWLFSWFNNPVLPTCRIELLLQQIQDGGGFSGTPEISGNGASCDL